jgi:hypothetical protein
MYILIQDALAEVDRAELIADIFGSINEYAVGEARKAVLRLIDTQKLYGENHPITEAALQEACDYHMASQLISLQFGDKVTEFEQAMEYWKAMQAVAARTEL